MENLRGSDPQFSLFHQHFFKIQTHSHFQCCPHPWLPDRDLVGPFDLALRRRSPNRVSLHRGNRDRNIPLQQGVAGKGGKFSQLQVCKSHFLNTSSFYSERLTDRE